MIVRSLSVEHFKCFGKFELPVAPLTLLTGFNGAGKSSSLQPLLLMAQALREEPIARTLPLNGALVRLGTAGDVVSQKGDGATTIGFSTDQESALWVFQRDRTLGNNELRLLKSCFSFDEATAEVPQWSPSGNVHPLIEAIRDVIFLSAVRQFRREAYPYPDNPSAVVGDVGSEGDHAAYWYVTRADEEVETPRRHPNEERTTVRGQIDAWLDELFPQASVNAEALPGVSLAKLSFKLGRSPTWRRPSNVGYGLSYAFPLLVALICSRPGQIIVVDSPEAHLHPRAQSTMGKILAHFAAAGLQLLIESHSDHLLSGIRLAVRQRTLSPDDVAVHFFPGIQEELGEGAPDRIEIDADGGVGSWPPGFFDQALRDLVELS
jgi:predicted ATPase